MTRFPSLLRLSVILAAAPLAAQQPVIYRPDSTPPREVRLAAPVEVPLLPSGLGRIPLPVVNVMVNGHGPYRFGVETGANFIAVSPRVADELHLTRNGGPDEAPEYRLDSISVGGATFVDLPASGLDGASGVEGLLGLPFWADVLLTIDYPAGELRIASDTLPTANGRDIVPLTRVGDFLGLPIAVAGKEVTAVLDTRSTGGIGFTPDAAAKLAFQSPPIVVGRAGGAAIPMTEVKRGTLSGDITLGRYTFPRSAVTIRALPPGFPQGAIVGTGVLSNFTLSLDQRHARLRLTRAGGDVVAITDQRPDGPPPGGPRPAPISETELTTRLSQALDSLDRSGDFSGVAVLAKAGVPIFQHAFGFADRERKRPITLATAFNIGSINKIFTNIAIHQLAAAGKVSFDSTLGHYWPDYPNAVVARTVTIGQLVQMQSGIGGNIFGVPASGRRHDIRRLADFLPLFASDTMDFPAGARRAYSNAGYVVLGLLVERLSGESYYDYVRHHIYDLAGMTGTAHYAVDSLPPEAAIGYTTADETGPDSPDRHPNGTLLPGRGSSAGGGYSTAQDLVRFIEALRERKIPAAPPAGQGLAGGTAGVNAALEGELPGGYDLVVLTNLDPPAAERVATLVRKWLGVAAD